MINDIKVKEVMTRGVISIPEESLVKDAVEILADSYVSALVVTSKDGELRAVLSEVDIIRIYDQDLSLIKVKEVMSAPVITIDKEEGLDVACRLMKEKNIHRLIVKQDILYQETNEIKHYPCGILSTSDIIHTLASLYS
ncbi:CBS domain-containing protein [bacterium]|nr:CBS domain-containing protein [bacterium]